MVESPNGVLAERRCWSTKLELEIKMILRVDWGIYTTRLCFTGSLDQPHSKSIHSSLDDHDSLCCEAFLENQDHSGLRDLLRYQEPSRLSAGFGSVKTGFSIKAFLLNTKAQSHQGSIPVTSSVVGYRQTLGGTKEVYHQETPDYQQC